MSSHIDPRSSSALTNGSTVAQFDERGTPAVLLAKPREDSSHSGFPCQASTGATAVTLDVPAAIVRPQFYSKTGDVC